MRKGLVFRIGIDTYGKQLIGIAIYPGTKAFVFEFLFWFYIIIEPED